MNTKPLQIACTGYSIAADWYQGKTTNNIMLVLSGYSSSKANQKDLTTALVKGTGASALAIDYSGHGESPFELADTRPAQHFLEVIYAFDWLKDQYPNASIWVNGSSYGGFLAVQLTKYRAFDKLILRAPAIYKPAAFYDLWAKRLNDVEAYQKMIQTYRASEDELTQHPLLARASKFQGKTLVVVHEHDEEIPAATTSAYIKTFGADSYVAKNFKHHIRKSLDQQLITQADITAYQQAIIGWLTS